MHCLITYLPFDIVRLEADESRRLAGRLQGTTLKPAAAPAGQALVLDSSQQLSLLLCHRLGMTSAELSNSDCDRTDSSRRGRLTYLGRENFIRLNT